MSALKPVLDRVLAKGRGGEGKGEGRTRRRTRRRTRDERRGRLRRRELGPGRDDPLFGEVPIREGGDSTVGLAGAVHEIQDGFHRCGPFADHDGATDRYLRIRRRGDQLRSDGFADPRLRDCVEIPNAIEGGIKGRVREQLLAGAEKFLIRDHALAGGDGESLFRVDGNGDRHGKESVATFIPRRRVIPIARSV